MGVWIFLTVFALICLGFTLLVNWKEDEMKKKNEIPKDGHGGGE